MKPGRWTGFLLFAAALALRGGWVFYDWAKTGAASEFPDEDLHWQIATHLAHEGTFISDDGRQAARMPLYPLYLALFTRFGDSGILAARLGQALLGAATVGLVYAFARAALGARAALVAGLLACFDPFAVFFSNLLLSETLFTGIAVALTCAAWRVARGNAGTWKYGNANKAAHSSAPPFSHSHAPPRWHHYLPPSILAFLGAAAVLTRESAIVWVPCVWLALFFFDPDRWRALRRTTLYAACLFACLLPWAWRNHVRLGGWVWLSANGGATLYDAQGPQADGRSDQVFLKNLPELQNLGELERDRALRALALAQMRADPRRVLQLAGTKFSRMWSLTPNVEAYRAGLTALAGAGFTLVVLLGTGLGLWRGLQSKIHNPKSKTFSGSHARFLALVLLPVACFTLLHCVFIGSVRYRVPLMPFLALAAGTAFISSPRPPAAPRG